MQHQTSPAQHGTVLVEVACPSGDEARRIGSSAVVRGLAASAHYFPIDTTYRWQDEVHHAHEVLLQLTTTQNAISALAAHIQREHTYQTPHTVVRTVADLPDGHDWVRDSTHVPSQKEHRSRVCYLTLSVTNLPRQAQFWADLLQAHTSDVSAGSEQRYAVITSTNMDVRLLLQRVPEQNNGKNALHLDLESDDLDSEITRAVTAGAQVLRTHHENGFRWAVLNDPEGNEFCILETRYPRLLHQSHAHPPST